MTIHNKMEPVAAPNDHIEACVQLGLAAHEQTRATLLTQAIAPHKSDEQVAGLKLRLLENEARRQSLEEKHTHWRDALEHYRQSVKEQRDRDQR